VRKYRIVSIAILAMVVAILATTAIGLFAHGHNTGSLNTRLAQSTNANSTSNDSSLTLANPNTEGIAINGNTIPGGTTYKDNTNLRGVTYKDNTKLDTTTFTPAESQPSQPVCYTAAQSWDEIGKTGCVVFTVGSTYTSYSGQHYLNQYSDYSSGFSAWIPAGYSFGASALNEFAGKTIDVSGTISQYGGAPEIAVSSPSQITIAH
jgi:hypothetical protein